MQTLRMKPYSVLFLGSKNSARSILAEAYLNWAGRNAFKAYSAGPCPSGRVDPVAIELLEQYRVGAGSVRSKSWDEFAGSYAPPMDLILVLSGQPVSRPARKWPGRPIVAHWPIEDPLADEGPDSRRRSCLRAFAQVTERVNLLLNLPRASLGSPAIQDRLDAIGKGRTLAVQTPASASAVPLTPQVRKSARPPEEIPR